MRCKNGSVQIVTIFEFISFMANYFFFFFFLLERKIGCECRVKLGCIRCIAVGQKKIFRCNRNQFSPVKRINQSINSSTRNLNRLTLMILFFSCVHAANILFLFGIISSVFRVIGTFRLHCVSVSRLFRFARLYLENRIRDIMCIS